MHVNILEIAGSRPRQRACAFAELRRPVRAACLTDFLEETPDFVDGLLPASRRTMTYVNRWLAGRPTIPATAVTRALNRYSAVAGAVDRGALYLSGFDIASRPAALLRTFFRESRLATALEVYVPPRRGVLRDVSALGWLYLLATLDPVFRGFRDLADVDMSAFPARVDEKSVARWLASLIPAEMGFEIAELLRAVRDIRLPGPIRANPVFGRLGPVAGSDGDWIAGDTLVELKCTTRGAQRIHVAQLLCYYAFDRLRTHEHEPFGFERLALCLPRQRCTLVGTVEEWLEAFGAPKAEAFVKSVGTWLQTCTRGHPTSGGLPPR